MSTSARRVYNTRVLVTREYGTGLFGSDGESSGLPDSGHCEGNEA